MSELQVVWFTLWVCGLTTLLILPGGIVLGWILARGSFPGKSAVETFVALPLVMPPVATGLLLLKLLGRRGPLGAFLEAAHFDVVFTWRAVVAAAAVMSLPLLVRSARVAFQEIDPRLEQIARTLGASELRVFRSVTLPLALRGILSGVVLAFARALGEFGATIVVAGNIPGKTSTLALTIYQAVQLGDDTTAFRLVAIAAGMAFLAVWTSEFVLRSRRRRS
jgi:molybdate transport system permease protein